MRETQYLIRFLKEHNILYVFFDTFIEMRFEDKNNTTYQMAIKNLQREPYFIERDSKAVAVTKVFNLENSEDEDELFVGKMKGHFSTLGITVIRDICLIFNDMFYTDDDEENAMYIAMDNGIPELTITDDVMKERLETIGLKMDEDGNIVENVES